MKKVQDTAKVTDLEKKRCDKIIAIYMYIDNNMGYDSGEICLPLAIGVYKSLYHIQPKR